MFAWLHFGKKLLFSIFSDPAERSRGGGAHLHMICIKGRGQGAVGYNSTLVVMHEGNVLHALAHTDTWGRLALIARRVSVRSLCPSGPLGPSDLRGFELTWTLLWAALRQQNYNRKNSSMYSP